MKLVKLSLVAAMAAGFMASSATATPLDELIKDVDASGFARMRYETEAVKDGDGEGNWNFKANLKLKTMIDDNFYAVVGGEYYYKDDSYTDDQGTQDSAGFDLKDFYFGYNIAGTSVMVGRQAVGAFFTDDMYGDGIKVVNSDIEGLTLAALYMDSLQEDSDIGTRGLDTSKHNLYGAAAIGSYDPVSFQLWYAVLEDVAGLFAVELAANFDVTDNVNVGLKGQYAFADIDSDFKAINPAVDDSDFWAIEASTKLFGLGLSAGYVDYSADKDKASLSSYEDAGQFIKYGEQLAEYSVYNGENHYFFVAAGYEIPNTGVSLAVEYLDGENEVVDGKTDKKEYVGRVAYQATEQLKFSSWYSHFKEEDTKTNKFRFEAKYSF